MSSVPKADFSALKVVLSGSDIDYAIREVVRNPELIQEHGVELLEYIVFQPFMKKARFSIIAALLMKVNKVKLQHMNTGAFYTNASYLTGIGYVGKEYKPSAANKFDGHSLYCIYLLVTTANWPINSPQLNTLLSWAGRATCSSPPLFRFLIGKGANPCTDLDFDPSLGEGEICEILREARQNWNMKVQRSALSLAQQTVAEQEENNMRLAVKPILEEVQSIMTKVSPKFKETVYLTGFNGGAGCVDGILLGKGNQFSKLLKIYKEYRMKDKEADAPQRPFPSHGFEALVIRNVGWQDEPVGWAKGSTSFNHPKWPDKEGRYWWKITCPKPHGAVGVINDFYWMEDKVRGYPDKYGGFWVTLHHTSSEIKIEGFCLQLYRRHDMEDDLCWTYEECYAEYTPCGLIEQWLEEMEANHKATLRKETGQTKEEVQEYSITENRGLEAEDNPCVEIERSEKPKIISGSTAGLKNVADKAEETVEVPTNISSPFSCSVPPVISRSVLEQGEISGSRSSPSFFLPQNLKVGIEQRLVEFAGIGTIQTQQTDLSSQLEQFNLRFANSAEYEQFLRFYNIIFPKFITGIGNDQCGHNLVRIRVNPEILKRVLSDMGEPQCTTIVLKL